MHPYNRIPSSAVAVASSSPSPPASPLYFPRYTHHHSHSKHGTNHWFSSPSCSQQPSRTFPQQLAWLILSLLLRHQGLFLFTLLLYISGMLLFMGFIKFEVVPIIKHRPAPGSVYRSPHLYFKLRPKMDADKLSADVVRYFFS